MQTTYTYDAMSRLAAIAGLGKSATYTRFAESNRLNTVSFGASYPQVNYSYDTQLRMTSKGLWTRTFNPKDEATQIAPAAGVQTNNLNWYHSYDAAGQLSQGIFGLMGPDGPAGTAYNYSYDQIGNHQLSGVTYNTVNQPSNLTYDANGNMTVKDGKQYIYDGENRLVRILENFYDAWKQGVEFHYDYAGRCYQRNDVFIDYTDSANNYNTPYEYIIYDGAKQVMTLDGDKNVTGKYVWQPESSGDADVILWDQDGVYSTDCNKNVVAYNIIPEWPEQPSATYYDYTPFGVPVGNAGSAQRFMFSSEEWFPARSTLNYGLILYLYRAYSPALARFLTRDPIEEQGGVNLYNFVGNNPVTRWDKWGLIDCCGDNVLKDNECCHNNKAMKLTDSVRRKEKSVDCCIKLGKVCLTGSRYGHQNITILDTSFSYGLNSRFSIFLFPQFWNSASIYIAEDMGDELSCIYVPLSIAQSHLKSLTAAVGISNSYSLTNT
ncbi:MAG: RHS repeat-associated core domain-containing protein [Victivallaceae bacterium]|nr:RHS repeat-associated core domain-containing protein [Victivallaceae bacterium]